MGPFWRRAASRDWIGLEEYFNPEYYFDEVHILSLGDDHAYETTRFGSVRVYPVEGFASKGPLRRVSDLLVILRAVQLGRRLVLEHGLTLVAQIYGGPLKFGVPAALVARCTLRPMLLTLHSEYDRAMRWNYSVLARLLAHVLWRWLFSEATHVRAVSDSVARFARDCGLPKERLTVIPNKEDVAKFRERPPNSELWETARELDLESIVGQQVVFLIVGRLFPPKNVDGMMRGFAIAAAEHSHLHLLIAGDGPQRAELERLRRRLDLETQVTFLGFVPHSRLRHVYHLSDALLFATHYEGQPRAVVEALLCGLPVICSPFGQVCDVVIDEEDGLWADPDNPVAIANAIGRLAEDAALRRSLGRHDSFKSDAYSFESVGSREIALFRLLEAETRSLEA